MTTSIVTSKLENFAYSQDKKSDGANIDFQSYLTVASLLNHHQFRAVQIVLAGLDSMPRDEILKIISQNKKVWDIMFKPLVDGEPFALYENKIITNA